jgi:hypothetical protein
VLKWSDPLGRVLEGSGSTGIALAEMKASRRSSSSSSSI